MSEESTDFQKAKLSHRLGMQGFLLFEKVLSWIPMKFLCRVSRGIGLLAWYALKDRRRIVARNLRIVIDPKLKGKELDDLSKENFKRTFANLLGSAKTATFSPDELKKHVTLEGYEGFARPSKEGKGCVCCVTHSGNWEILARIRVFYPQVKLYGSMYRPIDNPIMDKFIYDRRTESGTTMFSKEDGVKAPLQFVKQGGMMGVLCDQYLQQGLFIPYFGKITGTTSLPALLTRRTDAYSIGVCVRTDSLGHWVSDMGTDIDFNGFEDSIIGHTCAVNASIEKLLNKSILDGFWMHHRWKVTQGFAPQNAKVATYLASVSDQIKPFRILIVMPESVNEALFVLPMLRAFKQARLDMQINVACSPDQASYWSQCDEVAHVLPYKSSSDLTVQLDRDDVYQDGPWDMALLLDHTDIAFGALKKYRPICFGGSMNHPCAKSARFRVKTNPLYEGAPKHCVEEYLNLARGFELDTAQPCLFPTKFDLGKKVFVSPFSSLGSADTWVEEQWASLIQSLSNETVELLGMEKDRDALAQLAQTWGVDYHCGDLGEISQYLRDAKLLISVDGAIPMLAGNVGIPSVTIYSTRLPSQWRPLGSFHRSVYYHSDCFPCYKTKCDQATPCHDLITYNEVLDQVKSCLYG